MASQAPGTLCVPGVFRCAPSIGFARARTLGFSRSITCDLRNGRASAKLSHATMSNELWTVRDVAQWANISPNAAYKAIRRLEIPHAAYGRAGALLYNPAVVRAEWPRLRGRGARIAERGETSTDHDEDFRQDDPGR